MNYLELPYRLNQVEPQVFLDMTREAALLKLTHPLNDTLTLLLGNEDPVIIDHVLTQGYMIQDAYENGGAHYSLALGIGISVLRKVNPLEIVPAVNLRDWGSMRDREVELRSRFTIRTIEDEVQTGLDEISGANEGYVEGFDLAYGDPALADTLGLSGLGALCAHDLVHFASIRE